MIHITCTRDVQSLHDIEKLLYLKKYLIYIIYYCLKRVNSMNNIFNRCEPLIRNFESKSLE